MKKIDINEIREYLNYMDLRSTRKWCQKNEVVLMKLGKSEFAFESNFRQIIEREFINKLKNKFGDEWESVYRLHAEGDIPALNMLHDIPSVKYKSFMSNKKAKNKYAEIFENHGKSKAA